MWKKIAWFCACIVPYVHWLIWVGAFSSAPTSWEEKDVYLWAALAVLGFPGTLVWFYVAALIQLGLENAGVSTNNLYIANTAIWLGAVSVGYAQWFYFVPLIKRYWQSRRSAKREAPIKPGRLG